MVDDDCDIRMKHLRARKWKAHAQLQIVRLVGFAGPTTDESWNSSLSSLWSLLGGKILELQIVRFVVFAGLATAKFWKSRS